MMKGRNYWGNTLTRIALVVATVGIIVAVLPRNSGPQFRYEVCKPWMYGSLIAKFDFPIYKTEKAIKTEQDSALRCFEPYYNYDPQVEREQMARFLNTYKKGIPGLPRQYVSLIADRLHRLYQEGIMETAH